MRKMAVVGKIENYTQENKMEENMMEKIRRAAEILKSLGAKDVYLFGSAATGNYRKGSDIDLAVTGLPPEKYYHAVGEMMTVLRHSVDLIDLDEKNEFTEFLNANGALHHVE